MKRALLIGSAALLVLPMVTTPSAADVIKNVGCRLPVPVPNTSPVKTTLSPIQPICQKITPPKPKPGKPEGTYLLGTVTQLEPRNSPRVFYKVGFPCVVGLPPKTSGEQSRAYCSTASLVATFKNGVIIGSCLCTPGSSTCKLLNPASSLPRENCKFAAG